MANQPPSQHKPARSAENGPVNGRDVALGYLFLRVSMGVNMLMHGVSRVPDMGGFAQHTANGFDSTFIPHGLAWAAAVPIPLIEIVVGALLIVGLFTRITLVAGAALMLPLIFGICLQQKWPVAGSQLIYCIVYFLLLAGCGYNRWSVDALASSSRVPTNAE